MKAILQPWLARLKHAHRPDEYEVKDLLGRLGLTVPQGVRLAHGTAEVIPDFPGPYVAKVCSPAIDHKTDSRGVYLNLGQAELKTALRDLFERFPQTPVLVETMVAFEGPEMIVGGLVDPAFGPAVMVGAGGILTEIFQDVAFRLAPLEAAEAGRMLAELKIHPVFEGYRGLQADPAALARLLVVVGRLVDALGARFDQLDLNPVVWSAGAWMVLDARLMLHPA